MQGAGAAGAAPGGCRDVIGLASVFAMRFVSVVSVVSVVSLRGRVHPKGRCSGVVSHPRMGLVMMHQVGSIFRYCCYINGYTGGCEQEVKPVYSVLYLRLRAASRMVCKLSSSATS